MLEQSGVKVTFNHALVSQEIDGIQYIFTHNHLGLSKNDMVQTFWEYGAQGKYNVLLGGHFHSRRGKTQYKKIDNIHWDQANYRSIRTSQRFRLYSRISWRGQAPVCPHHIISLSRE
jgi:hypothetical protein